MAAGAILGASASPWLRAADAVRRRHACSTPLVEDQYALAMMETEIGFVTELIDSLLWADYIKSGQETLGSSTCQR